MTTFPKRSYYPNAAMSGEELHQWAGFVVRLSSAHPFPDPEQILQEETKLWGKPRRE